MGKVKRSDSFWLSYSDLMTSLFFIMLVMFIACIIGLSAPNKQIEILKKENGEIRIDNENYKKLLKIDETFKGLSANQSLRYDDTHKTFVAKDLEGIEIFNTNSNQIKQEYLSRVDKVGRELQSLLQKLDKDHSTDVSYLLIVEGNTANTWNKQFSPENSYAYKLSYERALALYQRWCENGINLRQYNTEVQICGSGMNGINRDNETEENNKRFIIQIIPKISRPKI